MSAKNSPRPTNERIKLLVLLKNKRACCVCHASDKAIQLHHISGNPALTVEENLAVLCLTHHDQATAGLREGQVGLGLKLTPVEVVAHKRSWEAAVTHELNLKRRSVPNTRRQQIQVMFEFELTKIKNEILASRSASVSSARFRCLTQYVIDEFISGIPYRNALLNMFHDTALRGAGDDSIALPLVAALLDLHSHLQGPHYVPIDSADRSALRKSVNILDTVGIYGVEIARGSRVLARACRAIEELVELSSWYQFKNLRSDAIRTLQRFEQALAQLSTKEKQGMDLSGKQQLVARTLRVLISKAT